ncbi:SusC/RagA family TonB-linked outer membrane protein [Pedobacter faecalis]|uniref:SusC/RagA family TonB-linked outer membrane protein n=1 Tax=Pedobacter faecalis TaxID=3041495 RepID=UPI00254EDE53|nr:SusC/RagA family TonB-linked outer membrane protein [Pedobacter sp. ELA7]
MKKLWLLAILAVLHLAFQPQEIKAQTSVDRTITYGVRETTLKNAFQELERLSGFSVNYNNTKLNDQRVITVSKAERSVKQVLGLLLNGTPFTFKMGNGNNILIVEKPSTGKIVGKVIDENGQPLPSAVVRIGSLGLARQTNSEGNVTLEVPAGTYTIDVSYISYEPFQRANVQVRPNANTSLSARLQPANNALSEVVVTALGIRRQEKALGYAVTKVDSTQLTTAVATNWTDALSGKVAGLNLVRNSGPAGSNKIILRGENNLTGDNEALIVIDGVVSSNSVRRPASPTGGPYGTSGDNLPADFGSGINDLNPDDIAEVTVLKGPGATALYGQRGANGAVIITTKSGNAKKRRLSIGFTSNTSWEEINRGPDSQYEFGQGQFGVAHFSYGASADGSNQNSTSASWGAPFDGQSFFQYDPTTKKAGTVRTPWRAYENPINSFFRRGYETNNSVSLEGTYKTVAMRFSASHGENDWIVPNTGLERTSATFSANAKPTRKLDVNVKAIYNNRHSDNLPATGYGNQSLMYWFMFAQPNVNVDWYRDYWAPGQQYRQFVNITTTNPESPYAISEQYLNTQKRNGVLSNVQATYKFSDAFSAMVRGSIDYASDDRTQKRPWDAAGSKFAQGSYRVQEINMREISGDFMLTYNKQLHKNLSLTARVGGSTLRNNYYKDEQRADGLIVPNEYSLSNAANDIIFVPDTAEYQLNSVYALASLTYKNYLYLDLTGRADWNSVLATPTRTDNVGFTYPSASLSFIASDYFKLPKAISLAKLRISAAQVGSGTLIPYRTAYNYSLASSGIYPDSGSTNPSTLPNPNLKPLKTTTFEAGAEMQFFKGRLGFDVAVYAGNTRNQILTRQIDRSSGYSNAIINAGRVDNRGLEVALNAKPISVKNGFEWAVNMTFSTNKNEIKALSDSSIVLRTGALGGGQVVANVGGSMGDLYGIGFLRSPDGQIVYDATSGFAKVTSGVIHLGNTIPQYRAGISNTFSYKGFSLSTLFDAQVGAVAHSLTFSRMAALGKLKATLPGRYNGIIGKGVVQNPDGSYRTNDVVATDIQNYYTSVYGSDQAEGSIFSTDFIKFREASLGYAFKPGFVKKLSLSRLSISAYGRNLFIWSPWPAFDPEFGTLSGTDIVTGFETGQLPSTRTYGIRLVAGI